MDGVHGGQASHVVGAMCYHEAVRLELWQKHRMSDLATFSPSTKIDNAVRKGESLWMGVASQRCHSGSEVPRRYLAAVPCARYRPSGNNNYSFLQKSMPT